MNLCPYIPHLLSILGETLYKGSADNAVDLTKNRAPVGEAANKGTIYVVENCRRQNVISQVNYIWCLYFFLLVIVFFMLSMMIVCCD